MDSFYFNKIAGAVLSCLLLLVGLRTFTEIFYPKGEANLSTGTIVVTSAPVAVKTPEHGQQQKPADPPVQIVLASANVDAGQNAAKKCAVCHTWNKDGKNAAGPNLYGVVGRDIGKHPGFTYSAAVQNKGGKWTFEELYSYLKNPKEAIPGNKMTFGGIDNPQERANLIAFLDKQSDNPLPLPGK